jgi:DNA recombination protein RmuC
MAVKIYEKLAAFIEDFEKVGGQIDRAGAVFQEARKKLHTGKGNLVSQALRMKGKLGHNKPNRELPQGLVEEAEAAEDSE